MPDAIRDQKVLKFKVDYHSVYPKSRAAEQPQANPDLLTVGSERELMSPGRIRRISEYILDHFHQKTHRNGANLGFNAMFAVARVESAKLYYSELQKLQKPREHPLKIASIFSFAPNEDLSAVGEIQEEELSRLQAMKSSDKEFLAKAIEDYNQMFKTNFSLENRDGFENYYRDLAKRMKSKEPAERVDLTIVVGMFLTGFDAPTMNTLFVDKNLRYHGLIQAFSRTNRVYDSSKTCGNIVSFRNLEQNTYEAIKMFATDGAARDNPSSIILEKKFADYIYLPINSPEQTNAAKLANANPSSDGMQYTLGEYSEKLLQLKQQFPPGAAITTEHEKRDFVKILSELLKCENKLRNYDEFTQVQKLQSIDATDYVTMAKFKEQHGLTDEKLHELQRCVQVMRERDLPFLSEREQQDYNSHYQDIYNEQRIAREQGKNVAAWDDVEWEIELLKSMDIDFSFILGIIKEYYQKCKEGLMAKIEDWIAEIRRLCAASVSNRVKAELLVGFIKHIDAKGLDFFKDTDYMINDTDYIIEYFYDSYVPKIKQEEMQKLIAEHKLNADEAEPYIEYSLRRGHASDKGTDLDAVLPKMSRLYPEYLPTRNRIFQAISDFVQKFKGL